MGSEIQIDIEGVDRYSLHGYKWLADCPRGTVHIVHGLAEHSLRYAFLAEKLNEIGFNVFACDHRGHGLTVRKNNDIKGLFSYQDGWFKATEDLVHIHKRINEAFPSLPLIMLGHSMGSFLTQNFIMKHGNNVNAVILTGTNWEPSWYLGVLSSIVRFEKWRLGCQNTSVLIEFLFTQLLNAPFRSDHKSYGWVCSDKEEVKKYEMDEFCGFPCSTKLWDDFIEGMKFVFKADHQRFIPKELPIYILGGKEDPVGQYGKGILLLVKKPQKAGLSEVSFKIYKNMRHEILNEYNKELVISDITRWLISTLFPAESRSC